MFNCKGCEKRHVGCHAEFESYQAAKAKNDAAREQRNHETQMAFGVFESNYNARKRVLRKRWRSRR